jgi:hypothetical protein
MWSVLLNTPKSRANIKTTKPKKATQAQPGITKAASARTGRKTDIEEKLVQTHRSQAPAAVAGLPDHPSPG